MTALPVVLVDALQEALRGHFGRPANIKRVTPIAGGSIARAYVLDAPLGRAFLKLHTAAQVDLFAAEADGLRALAACADIRVPAVLALGTCDGEAYLLLEHIDLHPITDRHAEAAGHALASLHRVTRPHFGWSRSNYIGATAQSNTPAENWPKFFVEQRLRPQLERAAQCGASARLVLGGQRLIERVPTLLAGHTPAASLVHGDLWNGNAALDPEGKLVLFDPAIYFGDWETDLAMMALFGGFPAPLLAAYREVWTLSDGFETRRGLYQLYHILNHFSLFGGDYVNRAERIIERLLTRTHE